MSGRQAEPLRKGTLVCVVLKAKNLPNKRSIGKQDPYCVLTLGADNQRTKPDKRGGQHPHWDEQINFDIFEDLEEALQREAAEKAADNAEEAEGTVKVPNKTKKTPQLLKICCYADDPKEPELIGEAQIDLTDTLNAGEFDEWVVVKAKDRYAGEVFLELTYYSAASPPRKKKAAKKPLVSGNDTYGGAGTFTNDIDDTDFGPRHDTQRPSHGRIPSHMRPGLSPSHESESLRGSSSMRGSISQSRLDTSSIPSSLRPSASLAQIETYTPPYAPASIARSPSPNVQAPAADTSRRQSYQDSPGSSMHGNQAGPMQGAMHSAEVSRPNSFSGSVSPVKGGTMTRPGPDPMDALTRPMSAMSFSSINKPLPPPGPPSPYGAPVSDQLNSASPYQPPRTPQPPQDHYSTLTSHHRLSSISPAPPSGLVYVPQGATTPVRQNSQQSYATPPQNHEQLAQSSYQQGGYYTAPPPPQPQEAYANQGQYVPDYRTLNGYPSQGLAAQHVEPARSTSPGPVSYHALPPIPGTSPAQTASVINAQSYYQQAQQSPSQQQHQPSGSPHPSVPPANAVQYQPPPPQHGSPYGPPPQQNFGYSQVPRPLPSTQPPQQSPSSYDGQQTSFFAPPPTNYYQPPPPQGQYAQQWAQPPSQPGPYGPPPGSAIYGAPPVNAATHPPQGQLQHGQWAPPPPQPGGYPAPGSYAQVPLSQQYVPPPGSGHGQQPSYPSGSYMVPPPPPSSQHPGHYAPYTQG